MLVMTLFFRVIGGPKPATPAPNAKLAVFAVTLTLLMLTRLVLMVSGPSEAMPPPTAPEPGSVPV